MKPGEVIIPIPGKPGLFRRGLARVVRNNFAINWLKPYLKEIRFYYRFKKFHYGDEFRDYVCRLPFEYAELTGNGDLDVCCYLPKKVGNIKQAPFNKAWNSLFARKLRKSMLDGSFCYCDKSKCRSMQNFNGQLIKKSEIAEQPLKRMIENSATRLESGLSILSLGNDYSCNLKCPSCRVGMRKMGVEESDEQFKFFNALMSDMGQSLKRIHIAGDGDPFASRFYGRVLTDTRWQDFPELQVGFQTNGIALTEKKWSHLPTELRKRVTYIGISIDGATAETYERLRVGGKFEQLVKNISYLSRMEDRKSSGISLRLNMIVQRNNYQEIVSLVRLGRELGVDSISFTYIRNWGTFQKGEYEQQAVHLPDHPEHAQLLEILKDPTLDGADVDLGNLADLVETAADKTEQ